MNDGQMMNAPKFSAFNDEDLDHPVNYPSAGSLWAVELCRGCTNVEDPADTSVTARYKILPALTADQTSYFHKGILIMYACAVWKQVVTPERYTRNSSLHFKRVLMFSSLAALTSCSAVALKEGGTLSSYERLGETRGRYTKSRTYVDVQGLRNVKTVSIVPTTFTSDAASRIKTAQDRYLVANALDRALCVSLSDRYRVISPLEPADLRVKVSVTDIVVTNQTAAGLSAAATLGTSFVLPVGVPRLPVGLGGLAVEAEAIDPSGTQLAAAVWSKGANSISNGPRVSEVGDAYALGATFGTYFSQLLIRGQEPSGVSLSLPSAQRIGFALGGKPKYSACDAFGRSPGLLGIAAGSLGAPPAWTDKVSSNGSSSAVNQP